MLSTLDYNSIKLSELVGGGSSGSSKRKRKASPPALSPEEDRLAREDKRLKTVSQSLLESARKGDVQMCIQAIRDGADVSFQSCGLSALYYAAFYGHDMVIDYLINCGANVNEKNLTGVTPIAKAVESGRPNALNTVQCLLKHRADTNIADVHGNTPLMKAVKSSNIELFKCLVGYSKTNVNIPNKEENTALHEAAYRGNKEMVDALIAAGARVDARNTAGKTPLHRAVSGDHLSVVTSLLDKGAAIDAQDAVGYTPIHYAAFFGLLESTKLLVQRGANITLKEKMAKKNCLELAQERRHYTVVEYLSRVEHVTIPLLHVSIA